VVQTKPKYRDYSLTGPEHDLARKKGLASGQWFAPFIERKTLRALMKRDDYHATRDTIIWFGLIFASGYMAYSNWQSGNYKLFAFSFWIYCTLYTSAADSRWHECGHATAFKTKWKSDLLYNIASFMVMREPLVWRFSHARHHTDTDIVGRDPEVDARPLDMWNLAIAFFNVQGIRVPAITHMRAHTRILPRRPTLELLSRSLLTPAPTTTPPPPSPPPARARCRRCRRFLSRLPVPVPSSGRVRKAVDALQRRALRSREDLRASLGGCWGVSPGPLLHIHLPRRPGRLGGAAQPAAGHVCAPAVLPWGLALRPCGRVPGQ
jgi:hypothetical protein